MFNEDPNGFYYLRVNVTLRNTSNMPKNTPDMVVVDQYKNLYYSSFVHGDNVLHSKTVNPKQTVSGDVYFDVNDRYINYFLIFVSGYNYSKPIHIRFN